MTLTAGNDSGPLLLLHAGAGPMDPSHSAVAEAERALESIAREAAKLLQEGTAPLDAVTFCLERMEAEPRFNAGVGSALQADGTARLSAALMNGVEQRFSGVVNVTHVPHPSAMVRELQRRTSRVLSSPGVELLARELDLPVLSNLTEGRAKRWLERLEARGFEPLGPALRGVEETGSDTVGCVLRTSYGELFVGASTGGRGFEYPGRVSDTCSIAGTYASCFAAIAATGVGEEIIDDALAARVETRVRDGATLADASRRALDEARERARSYAWIAASASEWCIARTTASLPHVVMGGAHLTNLLSNSTAAT